MSGWFAASRMAGRNFACFAIDSSWTWETIQSACSGISTGAPGVGLCVYVRPPTSEEIARDVRRLVIEPDWP